MRPLKTVAPSPFVAALFIVVSIALVAISRDEIRETQSVLEKEQEEDVNIPQIPQSPK